MILTVQNQSLRDKILLQSTVPSTNLTWTALNQICKIFMKSVNINVTSFIAEFKYM